LSKIMKEAHIRPPELKQKQESAFLKDVGKLLSRYDEFVECWCPACSSKSRDYKFQKKGFHYWECTECQTVYINPRPDEKLLGWFYGISEVYKYWNQTIFPETNEARKEKIIIPRVDRIIDICDSYDIKRNSLLEIGSGYGTFLEEIQNRNAFKHILGLEPSADLAQTCKSRGLNIIETPIEQYSESSDEFYDVIVSFEVLEHLADPKSFVRRCHNLLKKGGLLVLTCPNGKGFDVLELGINSDTFDHEHLNYFNPSSMELMLKDEDFQVLEIITPGKLDAEIVRTKALENQQESLKSEFLNFILCKNWESSGDTFQEFLANNKLSSHMWSIARKNT